MNEIIGGCFQLDVLPGDVDRNVDRAEAAISQLAKDECRLVVLPEMWSCSFVYPVLKGMAEKSPSVVDKLREWGRRYGMVLVGSLPAIDGGTVFNTTYVIDSGGEVVGEYRKIHLFSFSGEHHHFGRGSAPQVVSTSVGRLGIMICYDLRFPELARRLALEGAEILCVSALWPKPRIEHWSLLLRARALENQMFVMGCNGSGTEGKTRYGGESAIVSPTGQLLAQAGDGVEKIRARMNMDEMVSFRSQIKCFSDRVPGIYGIP